MSLPCRPLKEVAQAAQDEAMHEDMNHVPDAFPTGIDDVTHSSPALPYALIQRSAWKERSRKFVDTEFYELRLERVLESSNSKLYLSKTPRKALS